MFAVLVMSFMVQTHAEEKTCVVKGMVCQNCVEMVTQKVCDSSFATCRVRLLDKKKRLGEIVMATKDASAKIDMKRIDGELAALTYAIESCRAGAASAKP